MYHTHFIYYTPNTLLTLSLSAIGTLSSLHGYDTGTHPNILWTARKKADYKLPLVGFASIMSVVERERAMEELQKSYPGYELGTGYGNCEVTQRFLRQSLDEGSYVLPVTRVINKAAQKISKQFWAEGGRVPIPSRHLVGQTLGAILPSSLSLSF
jgi:ribonuclease HII